MKAVKKTTTNTCASYSDNCNANGNSYELILVCLQKGVSNEIAILVQVTLSTGKISITSAFSGH